MHQHKDSFLKFFLVVVVVLVVGVGGECNPLLLLLTVNISNK